MQMLQERSQRRALSHLSKGVDFVFTALARHSERVLSALALRSVDILGEALAAIAVFAVRIGDVGVGVVDVARMYLVSSASNGDITVSPK